MKLISTLFVFTLALFLITGCGESDTDSAKPDQTQTADKTDGKASSSSANLFTVNDLNGNVRTADEWIGKQPVVINFWGTWCPPCRREIPELVKLYAEYKPKGVEILGVALERSAGPAQIAEFALQNSMSWVLLEGNEAIARTYQIQSVPTLVMYDASGKEVNRLIGLHDPATLREAFESII